MDAFEKKIKSSLDQYEVPYNSADWAQMERALDGQVGNGRWSSAGLLALLLGGLLVTGTVLYIGSRSDGSLAANEVAPEAAAIVDEAGKNSNAFASDQLPMGGNDEGQVELKDEVGVITGDEAMKNTNGLRHLSSEQDLVAHPRSGPDRGTTVANERTPENEPTSVTAPEPSSSPDKQAVVNTDGLAIEASAVEGCPGTSIRFSVSNMPEEGIYLWNFGDGSFSNKPVPEHLFAKSGKFEVMLSVSSTDKGNIKNNPSSGHIVIHEAPDAKFHYSKQEFEGHIPSVHFENRSLGGVSYRWDFGDGNSSTIAHPDHVFRKQGTYQVQLSVMNEKGCVDKYEREIHIDKDYTLGAPATFSPNGDGVEDTFMPQTLRDLGVKFDLVIHEEKTGRQVFRTSDASIPWTGRVMNGSQLCSSGEYVWMVEIHEGAHIGDVVYDGKVSLVR